MRSTDEHVPAVVHNDTCKALRNLYDVALETRTYVRQLATVGDAEIGPLRRRDARGLLERLDAALADAQEELL